METRSAELVKLLRSLWREILGGVIAIGLAAALGVGEVQQWSSPILLVGGALLVVVVVALCKLLWRPHKVLVYVSSGSTCRDPMAKAITEQLLVGKKLKHRVDIYAVGLVPSGTEASFGARTTIKKMYREDLLKDHKPATFTPELVDKADLILVMDKRVLNATTATLPASKTHLLKEFFLQEDDDIVESLPGKRGTRPSDSPTI